MSAIYTLTFRGDSSLMCGCDPTLRLELAVGAIATIGSADEGSTFALPAGFLQASSAAQRDEWAEQLVEASRELGVGLAFGIDRADEEVWGMARCPRSFAFVCDRGRRLLWAEATSRERKDALADRLVTIRNRRVLVLLQNEIFRRSARFAAEATRPDLTMVLAYGGPTPRWTPALTALDRLAPTLIVHDDLYQRHPVWTDAPRGWRTEIAAKTAFVTVHRFALEADGAPRSAVGN
jgi:hypothetical protein